MNPGVARRILKAMEDQAKDLGLPSGAAAVVELTADRISDMILPAIHIFGECEKDIIETMMAELTQKIATHSNGRKPKENDKVLLVVFAGGSHQQNILIKHVGLDVYEGL